MGVSSVAVRQSADLDAKCRWTVATRAPLSPDGLPLVVRSVSH